MKPMHLLASAIASLTLSLGGAAHAGDAAKFLKTKGLEAKLELLLTKDYAKELAAFGKKHFVGESIEFLQAVAKGMKPKEIYDTFIKQGASKEVNIPASLRTPLDKLAAEGKFKEMKFAAAVKSIKSMLQVDAFSRYVNDLTEAAKATAKPTVVAKPVQAAPKKEAPAKLTAAQLLEKFMALKDKEKVKAALEASKKSYADDQFSFLIAVRDYKAADQRTRGVLSERMLSFFIDSTGKGAVNIAATLRDSITKARAAAKKAGKYPEDLFDGAAAEVRRMFGANGGNDHPKLFEALRKMFE